MVNMYFSDCINKLMKEQNLRISDLIDMLNNDENITFSITASAIKHYRTGRAVPTYDKAKGILNCLGYQIPESELLELLDESRNEKDIFAGRDKTIKRGVSISLSEFNENIDNDMLENLIEKRAAELYGKKANFNKYVTWLIKEDLISHNYIER